MFFCFFFGSFIGLDNIFSSSSSSSFTLCFFFFFFIGIFSSSLNMSNDISERVLFFCFRFILFFSFSFICYLSNILIYLFIFSEYLSFTSSFFQLH
eukprot:UN12445